MIVDALIAPLLSRLADRLSSDDLRLVELAYERARERHEGQFRRSGDPYITHSVEVASLVAAATTDPATICAALLHDVHDEPAFDLGRADAEFGAEIRGLVADVAVMERGGPVSADDRVLLLKLFDRLHNMRTIEHLAPEKQRVKSLQTLEWLVPVARRLDLASVADELQSLAQARLDPGPGFTVVRAASLILPASARRRYLQEWSAELATLSTGRRIYILELLCGVPALAVVLWRPQAQGVLRPLLIAAFRTPVRPWLVLAPLLAWLTFKLARSSFADALAFVLAVPPALSTLITRIRTQLGLKQDSDTETD
jgi:GTP pyrophosphokinase